jgi:hypothetical protein
MNTKTKLPDRADLSQAMKQWCLRWHPYELQQNTGWILERISPDYKVHHRYPQPAVFTEEAARALCDRLNKEVAR